MASSLKEIKEQILKCKRLMENAGTEGEAAAAAAAMQRLLQRYNIDLSEIKDSVESDVAEERHLLETESEWRLYLMSFVAKFNFCEALRIPNFKVVKNQYVAIAPTIIVIGAPYNREVVAYMYKHLVIALERLAATQSRKPKARGYENPRKSFLMGAVRTIGDRLKAEYEEFKVTRPANLVTNASAVPNDKALVVVETNERKIDDYLYNHSEASFRSMSKRFQEETAEKYRKAAAEAAAAETPAQRAAREKEYEALSKLLRRRSRGRSNIRRKRSRATDYDAFQQGRAAGATIPLSRGGKGISDGS